MAVVRRNVYYHDKYMELYKQGLSDVQLGKQMGISGTSIGSWRRKHGLPANAEKKQALSQLQRDKIVQLNKEGFSDKEISIILGIHNSTVCRYREKMGIPRAKRVFNYKTSQGQAAILTLYHRGYSDPQIGKKVGCSSFCIRQFRVRNGLKANHAQVGGRKKHSTEVVRVE